jgi:hypothetical protein
MTDISLPAPSLSFPRKLTRFRDILLAALLLLLLAFSWSAVAVVADSIKCEPTSSAFSSGFLPRV